MSELLKHGGIEIEWTDVGTHWRATNASSRIDPATCQTLDHVSAGGSKSGIKYAVGPDELTGQVNILYVDWPKNLFTLEELRDSPQSAKFFAGCNVCSAVNQLKSDKNGNNILKSSAPSNIVPADMIPIQSAPVRLSAGSSSVPKYIPVVLGLVKNIWLSKLGGAATDVVLALGADLMSGLSDDPQYRKAWQCVSDDMVDGVAQCMADPHYIEQVKGDVAKLIEGYKKDSNLFDAMMKSMVRPTNEILKGAGIEVGVEQTKNTRIRVGKLYSPGVD
jgi:hypothetical protein